LHSFVIHFQPNGLKRNGFQPVRFSVKPYESPPAFEASEGVRLQTQGGSHGLF